MRPFLATGQRRALAVVVVIAAAAIGILLLRSGDDSTKTASNASGGAAATSAARDESAPSSAGRIWTADFETGDLSQWEGVQAVKPDRARVVTSPHTQGRYAGRFEVREGEFLPMDAPTRNRTEAVLSTAHKRHHPVEGSDWWYSWSFYIPASTPVPKNGDDGYMTITQFLSTGPTTLPQPDFQLGAFGFADSKARGDPGPGYSEFAYTDRDKESDPDDKHWSIPAKDVKRDVWHDIVLHRKWSSNRRIGFIELWYDDRKQTLRGGKSKEFMRTLTAPYSAYLKQGIYRSDSIGGTAVIFLDGLRIGKTRAAVES
jgi:hypothetical protein